MSNFHVNEEGKILPCKAKTRPCKYGNEEHFDSVEKAQEYCDIKNERDLLIKEYKEKPKLGTKLKIKKLNLAMNKDSLDGLYSQEELEKFEKERQEREHKIQEAKRIEQENYQKFIEAEYLEMPDTIDSNFIVPRSFYSKIRMNNKIYRGEQASYDGKENTGVAMFGQGLYTTTNKKYASLYGKVREVEVDETPSIPLVLKDETSFNHFVNETCRKYGFSKSMLSEDISKVIQKMGYDGLVFGPKNDMIIVNYGEK